MPTITRNPLLSIVIISFNTKGILKECLQSVRQFAKELSHEVIVVDNASHDGSPEMVSEEFPEIRLIQSGANVGFGPGNNLAFKKCLGRYVVLLNSDAFLHEKTLLKAFLHMEENPKVGLGGARLIGRDGSWQPSSRLFPSHLNNFLLSSGLASKYPKSHFFGRADRTWASQDEACETDWVPGAFAIVPRRILEQIGGFDERFFLYYEEVDLCKKIRQAGYQVWYWPDVIVTHLGGESTKQVLNAPSKGNQLTKFRLESGLLYYRKHQGWLGATTFRFFESFWNHLRICKNRIFKDANSSAKIEESRGIIHELNQAWKETHAGKTPSHSQKK